MARNDLVAFNRNVDDLVKQVERSLPEIVMDAAKIVEDEIKKRTPVKSGALQKSIGTRKLHSNEKRATVLVEAANNDQQGYLYYGFFLEFGTSKMAAKPFFRPGVHAAKDRALKSMGENVKGIIYVR